MTYYVEPEMLGDAATDADARRMVELLIERGVDAALGSPLQYDHDPDECPDAVWEACLDALVIEATVRAFTAAFVENRAWQLGQTIPGLDAAIVSAAPPAALAGDLAYTMQPQEWLRMALYGAGLADADAGEIHDICQSLAEWLFAVPGESAYSIPDAWASTPMGALWWAALIRAEGDELITVAEAADLAGVSVKTISNRIDRGTLRAFVDPSAPARQGRRLVRRSDVAP